MAKKDRMKNGLDLLFEDNFSDDEEKQSGGEVTQIRISLIEPDKDQPRTIFDEQKITELAENIAQHGVLQPILIRPLDNGSYKIVAGERRWRAARAAGLDEIPAVVREMTDFEAAQFSLIENLQREDLNPIEEARAYRRLMQEFEMTQEQVANTVSKSRSAVANMVRLLKLPDEVQQDIAAGNISVGQAKVLCGIDDKEIFAKLLQMARDKANVRALEQASQQTAKTEKKESNNSRVNNVSEFEKFAVTTRAHFSSEYGIDATLTKKKNKYQLLINMDSEDEIARFIGRITEALEDVPHGT